MNVYIWDRIDNLTKNWHPEGGAVAVASSLEHAREMFKKEKDQHDLSTNSGVFRVSPTLSYKVDDSAEPRVFVFPDAGCC